MAEIPVPLLEKLSRIGMTAYDWRVLMVIIARTIGKKKRAAEITLDVFFKTTGIKKPHICRSLVSLEDRNIIGRVIFRTSVNYYIQDNLKKWRSFPGVKASEEAIKEWGEKFKGWYKHYPMPIYEEDTKNMYIILLDSGEATVKNLDEALLGYLCLRKAQAQKFNREIDPLGAMYPTTFLKDGKWREFGKFKDMGGPKW